MNTTDSSSKLLTLSNGELELAVAVPAAQWSYRGTRFSWAGIVDSVQFKGRSVFGRWQSGPLRPDAHDNVTGTAGEFGMGTNGMPPPLGFDEADTGGCFVKIGVGVLRRPDTAPYSFSGRYELVEAPPWQVDCGGQWVEMRQSLSHGVYGYDYVYRVELLPGQAAFVTRHKLSNTGRALFHQTHYPHNFMAVDQQPVGPGYEVLFPFTPESSFAPDSLAYFEGRTLKFKRQISQREAVFSPLTGFGGTSDDNQVSVRCLEAGVEVKITGDRPVVQFHFFAAHGAVCPEPFVDLRMAPGDTMTWQHRYGFRLLD